MLLQLNSPLPLTAQRNPPLRLIPRALHRNPRNTLNIRHREARQHLARNRLFVFSLGFVQKLFDALEAGGPEFFALGGDAGFFG